MVEKGGVLGEINQRVILRENVYKRDFLPFSTEMYFREKCLKVTFYKEGFMRKVLKVFFLFFNKDIEMSFEK